MNTGGMHTVCPYCGDEWHTREPFDCCGEVGHGVTLTQEQFDYMAQTGCNVDEAQERPDATPTTARHRNTTPTPHAFNAAANCTAMTDKPKMGRPTKPPGEKALPYSVRLTPERIAKLKLLKSAWLNKAIDRAILRADKAQKGQ